MLSKIRLQRFKKFQDVEVALRPFTILMGENSSGKTTILQAINFALQGLHRLYTRGSINTKNGIVHIEDKGTVYFLNEVRAISLSKVGDLYYGGKVSKMPAQINLVDESDNIYRFEIKSLFGSFNFRCTSSSEDLQNHPQLHASLPILVSGFVGINAKEERIFPKAIYNRVQSGRMSEIIRNLILEVKDLEGNRYERLASILEHYFNFRIDLTDFDEDQDEYINASFSEIRDSHRISLDLNSSGSGLLQILQILTPIYRFATKGNVVLLDEPDAHLHTNVQYTLAQALREVQRELEIQIIISTHSIPMIEAAEPSEIVPVDARMQYIEPLAERVDVDTAIAQLLDNYHLAKAKVSGKLLFVEDRNIDILKSLDRASGIGCFLGTNTIPYVAGDGKDNKAPFNSKKILKEYTKRDIEVHFIVDGDAMPNKWRAHFDRYAQGKVILHQLARHEIENYLIDPKLIARALKAKFPQKEQFIPSIEELREILLDIMKYFMKDALSPFKDTIEARLTHLVALNKEVIEEENNKVTGERQIKSDYYTPDKIKIEVRNIIRNYYGYSEFDQLIIVAPGKEVLRELNSWLMEKPGKLQLSKMDIANCLTDADVPDEIRQILKQLRSNAIESSGLPLKKETGKKKG